MDIWIKAAQLFLSLAILVTLHEFGHFVPARFFKTRVEKFYLFFNPWFSIFRYKKVNGVKKTTWFKKNSPEDWKGDSSTTEWGIGWLPLGGYVKIAGMVDESMDKEQLSKPAEPWEFRSKKAWQRLIIMVGGVTVNLLLGFLIYIFIVFVWGETQVKPTELKHGLSVHPYLKKYNLVSGDNIIEIEGDKVLSIDEVNKEIMLRGAKKLKVKHADGTFSNVTLPEGIDSELFEKGAFPAVGLRSKMSVVDAVVPKSNAEVAGLQKEDIILSVDGKEIVYYDELQASLFSVKGKTAQINVLRGANGKDTVLLKSNVNEDGTIGFKTLPLLAEDSSIIRTAHYGFFKSIAVGCRFGKNTLTDYIAQFKFVFTKKGASSVGGFASIGNMFPAVWDWQIFWLNTALLSIILAFMNILPIPALDGGHVVFLLYEMITGKEAPQKVLEVAQYVGIVLLLSLMLYANGNDLYKWLFT